MRLLTLRRFVPRRGGWRRLPTYTRMRAETFGRRPILAEVWAYLGWCQRVARKGS